MIKNLKRTAVMSISPPDADGNSAIKLTATSRIEQELTFGGLRYDSALKAMFELLFENELVRARGQMYKH